MNPETFGLLFYKQAVADLKVGYEKELTENKRSVVIEGGFVTPQNFEEFIYDPELSKLKEDIEGAKRLLIIKTERSEIKQLTPEEAETVHKTGAYKPDMTRAYVLVPKAFMESAIRLDAYGTDTNLSSTPSYSSVKKTATFSSWQGNHEPIRKLVDWGDRPLPCYVLDVKTDFKILDDVAYWLYIDCRDLTEDGYEKIGYAYVTTAFKQDKVICESMKALLNGNLTYIPNNPVSKEKGLDLKTVVIEAPLLNLMVGIPNNITENNRFRFERGKSKYYISLLVEALVSQNIVGRNTAALLLVDKEEKRLLFVGENLFYSDENTVDQAGFCKYYKESNVLSYKISGLYKSDSEMLNAKEKFLETLDKVACIRGSRFSKFNGKFPVPAFIASTQ